MFDLSTIVRLPVDLIRLPVSLLIRPVQWLRSHVAQRGVRDQRVGKVEGVAPLDVGGIDQVRAHTILSSLKQAGDTADDDMVAEVWLSALVAAQAAADFLLEGLCRVDDDLAFWREKMTQGGTWWFMVVQRGPKAFAKQLLKALRLPIGSRSRRERATAFGAIERRVVLLRALRLQLSLALDAVHRSAEVLLLRLARGVAAGQPQTRASMDSTKRNDTSFPGFRASPHSTRVLEASFSQRGYANGDASAGHGGLLGAAKAAAVQCSRAVSEALQQLELEMAKLVDEGSEDGASVESGQGGELARYASVHICGDFVPERGDGYVRDSGSMDRGRTAGPGSDVGGEASLDDAHKSVLAALAMVHVTFTAVPGRSAGEALVAMRAALRGQSRGANLPIPGWCRKPTAFQRHWLRYTAIGVAAFLASRWVVRNSRISGSDNLDRWVNRLLQDVRAGYKSNIERPLERLAKEATKQFKHRKGTVTTADVALNKRSLSRMLAEFERDFKDKGLTDKTPQIGATPDSMLMAKGNLKADDVRRMEMVMTAYEHGLTKPFRGVLSGVLVRSLLIQVQKLKVDAGIAMLELDTVLRSQELTLALIAALPALALVGSVASGVRLMVSPSAPDRKRMARPARLAAVSLEKGLLSAVQLEGQASDVTIAEARGLALLLASRLQFELDRLVSGPMAFTRHDEEWQMLRAEVQELGQHGDISDRLTTLQRIMRSYSVFTV